MTLIRLRKSTLPAVRPTTFVQSACRDIPKPHVQLGCQTQEIL